jgi:polysaccharide export outer membrane protein
MNWLLRIVCPLALALTVAACSLPRGAGVTSEVISGANSETSSFSLHLVSKDFLESFKQWPQNQSVRASSWLPRKAGPASAMISVGDVIDLQVWDSSENSLLTPLAAKAQPLTGLMVSPSGTIFVPYVGDILVKGFTPDGARKEIQSKVESLIPSAQVQLAHRSGRKNSVDLVGGVGRAGSYPLPDRNFTILGLLSAGGGVNPSLNNPQVRLVRRGKTYSTSLETLYDNPNLDTTLRGGDQVIVNSEKRFFLTMGAASKEATIYFNKDKLNALDAISLMGGINDLRANPQGILILRTYPKSALRTDETGPDREQVVFSIDLTHAEGLFNAGQFEIASGDVVLATESVVTAARTALGLFGTVLGIATRLE